MSDEIDTPGFSDQPPLRVGLIGVTGYALAYFEELSKLVLAGLVEWGAVTIINRHDAPNQVAFFESNGIPIYEDYQTMLEEEQGRLDWVCVPTAIGWHTRMTVDALRLGIPVLLEKPIAPTLQDAETIQAAERDSGRMVAIGYQHHYSDNTWEIKRRLINGEIGEIRSIDSICLWPRPQSYYDRNDWGGRQFVGDSWVLDSPLHNAISHVVNLILFFSGPTMESRADLVKVEAELYRSKPIQSYDTVRSIARFDTGARAGVVLSHSSKGSVNPEIRIIGSKGKLTWRFDGPHTLETAEGKVDLNPENQIEVRGCMFRNIVRRINGDASARICSTEQARGAVKWVNAVQDAARIHDVPSEFRRRFTDENGESFDYVENLDSWAAKAYEKNCWFGDLDVPWAVPRGVLDLRDYRFFQARTIPDPAPSVEATVS